MKKDKNIKVVIGLVLSVISITLIVVSFQVANDNGLLLNIGTEIIGIIITLLFVDYFVTKNKNKKLELVNRKLSNELYVWHNSIITSLRNMLDISLDDLFGLNAMYRMSTYSAREIVKMLGDAYNKKLKPNLHENLNNISKNKFDSMINSIKSIHDASINFQSAYNSILQPNIIEMIMDITNITYSIIIRNITWNDLFTTSDAAIKDSYDSEMVDFKNELQKLLIVDIDKLIEKLCEIGDEIT